jgi:phosphohistidine phosphatase
MGKKIGEVSDVPDVDIAEAGCFKYILIDVRDRGGAYGKSKLVVRGDASCSYHADVLGLMEDQIDESKLILDCKGGGRMRVNPQTRTISVYGYSMGFGRADHEKTVEILKKKYPQWTIEITDEEY